MLAQARFAASGPIRRYRDAVMRRLPFLLAVCFRRGRAALAACGGGGGGGGSSKGDGPEQTCAALDRLAGTAAAVEQANVADPEAFADALSHAVHAYTGELDALRKVAPDELQDPIDEVDHAMSKHHFADAVAARAPLDALRGRALLGGAPPTSGYRPPDIAADYRDARFEHEHAGSAGRSSPGSRRRADRRPWRASTTRPSPRP